MTLDAGQMYHIKSNEDLTGTSVRAVSSGNNDCKNIAVFGGNVFTNVGGCGPARDHLLEQMFPLSTWGENFYSFPMCQDLEVILLKSWQLRTTQKYK